MPQTLQTICDVIILIGAVAGAIMGIQALLGKPIGFFKKRREKNAKDRHDKIVKDVADNVKKAINPQLEEIFQQNLEQNEDIATLTIAVRDSIGAEILAFYESHKIVCNITEDQKDAIEDMYKAYKSIDGNHYVDKIYKKMNDWDITMDNGKVEKKTWWQPPKKEEHKK